MNWEAVTALSTLFTGIVIAVTAIAAVRQLRVAGEQASATRDQLEHLRAATRFEGLLAVFEELDEPHQVEARHFVRFELADRMKDPLFRDEVALVAGADERKHKELMVLRFFERVGFYVKKGFVDPDVVHMVAAGRVATSWVSLAEVVEIHRSIAGQLFWSNFEELYNDCMSWYRAHGLDVDTLMERQTGRRPPAPEKTEL